MKNVFKEGDLVRVISLEGRSSYKLRARSSLEPGMINTFTMQMNDYVGMTGKILRCGKGGYALDAIPKRWLPEWLELVVDPDPFAFLKE